jgi:hypothetical protein
MNLFKLFLFSIILASCTSTTNLTDAGQRVKVSTREPSQNCKELGQISGSKLSAKNFVGVGETQEGFTNIMKNRAAEMGANYVHVGMPGLPMGVAYSCPIK